ncbi:hypothetical protein ERICIV_03458 [Paenibacillus larvae subsp. larvae]|uniref:Uncharacterized protein n=2 Tax=Paenibacillus larvae TaxID=1464 RepID=A0A2L1U4I9_9BACL|nr:hypothetical protein [Paenibacillus larvae]AQT84179.1 hypothetical protein B1222_06905 [Paenibacillus larvae subsp. pulvifaciens]AQZ46159.1 hypothetical protein B5S25_05530 [Paenibacillus larvae subsp. pulvifaciens]AVF27824.1 hypothetical protein ERICIII_03715 [Paenibacillus larvae subsp. larvae]AVF32327.1 hypothetical protein ERICIV_03458 [Paenibacillus larvae subsp. larvae]MBH0342734.1 hypothetical protein [Paenibacillus larvae]
MKMLISRAITTRKTGGGSRKKARRKIKRSGTIGRSAKRARRREAPTKRHKRVRFVYGKVRRKNRKKKPSRLSQNRNFPKYKTGAVPTFSPVDLQNQLAFNEGYSEGFQAGFAQGLEEGEREFA